MQWCEKNAGTKLCVWMILTAKTQIVTQTQQNLSFLTIFVFWFHCWYYPFCCNHHIYFSNSLSSYYFFILKSLNLYVYTVLTIVNTLKDVLPKKCYLFYCIQSSFLVCNIHNWLEWLSSQHCDWQHNNIFG